MPAQSQSEKQKMLAGLLYDAADPVLVAERQRARILCQHYNALPADVCELTRQALLDELFGDAHGVSITAPFFCDYGSNLYLAERVYFNTNCVVLDVCPVTIGADTLFGPAVQIYAAEHPLDPNERRRGLESGRPVTIGASVWVGGGAIICPGVSIGDGSVIGAGSVVTRDIPAGVVAAGNPCRVLRRLPKNKGHLH